MKNYHEDPAHLTENTKDLIRALNSLKEEIEAIDWYQQRYDSTTDKSLKKILKHNQEEEIEHACMMLEWLRRNADGWHRNLHQYLFTEKEIPKIEDK